MIYRHDIGPLAAGRSGRIQLPCAEDRDPSPKAPGLRFSVSAPGAKLGTRIPATPCGRSRSWMDHVLERDGEFSPSLLCRQVRNEVETNPGLALSGTIIRKQMSCGGKMVAKAPPGGNFSGVCAHGRTMALSSPPGSFFGRRRSFDCPGGISPEGMVNEEGPSAVRQLPMPPSRDDALRSACPGRPHP
jgi:hypothetical protein